MNYYLPKTLQVGGVEVPILWDYRPVLDVLNALQDPDLSQQDRLYAALYIFYPGLEDISVEHLREAADKMMWFINGGEESKQQKRSPKLMDWEQDFNFIVAPINRVVGRDVREDTPLHWFSWLSAYNEIGDCTFAQIVRIRDKKARGKALDKAEREWYNRNRDIVHLRGKYSKQENEELYEFLGLTSKPTK